MIFRSCGHETLSINKNLCLLTLICTNTKTYFFISYIAALFIFIFTRYYLCTSCNDWETIFVSFKQPEQTTKLDMKTTIENDLNIDEQQALLMTLPNHHKWPFLNASETKYEQQFSTSQRRYPGSPRNRIIQAWYFRQEPFEIIFDILVNLFCCPVTIRYPKKEKRSDKASRRVGPKKRTLAEVLGFLQVITFELCHIIV